MKNWRMFIFFGAIPVLIVVGFLLLNNNATQFQLGQLNTTQNETASQSTQDIPLTTIIAKKLDIPWAIAFLPDGNMLVTERRGKVKLVNTTTGEQTTIATLNDVTEVSESGLLGIALHPNFSTNRYVYLYYTQEIRGTSAQNRVVRYTFGGQSLINQTIIVDGIPSAPNHDGGRIKFGPDGFLYIATGDAQNPSLAQDTNSLAGKILRVDERGIPPLDNPIKRAVRTVWEDADKNSVYSYGHRNPQGLAWDDNGNLWATEHGQSATDEFNLIVAGKNYGWNLIRGDQTRDDMVSPVIQSGNDTWAPSGAAYLNGSIYFAGLRGTALYEAVLDGTGVKELKTHFKGEFGRLREVIVGPDNMLYITTSNRDGRGIPGLDDDRLIRVSSEKLDEQ